MQACLLPEPRLLLMTCPQLMALSSWGQEPSMASGSGHFGQSHQLSYSGRRATGTHFLPWVSTLWYVDLLYVPPKN